MTRDDALRALRRLLANGPLFALPRKPADQWMLACLAASRFEPGMRYRESDVNDRLRSWLESFSDPHGIDHVTFRRMLVDARLLARTASGSTYQLSDEKGGELRPLADIDPAGVLAEARDVRESRRIAAASGRA
jgi:hypothetical protein